MNQEVQALCVEKGKNVDMFYSWEVQLHILDYKKICCCRNTIKHHALNTQHIVSQFICQFVSC